ncbi:MAG: transcriptional regulator, AraC family [Paenibacillaceae bacterium]|nr:transcriptional regulator, AraC family [Paenibacillaceae bacterium]
MNSFELSDLIILKICALNRVRLNSGESRQRKNRELWALAFKTAGRTVYESEGKTWVSDSSHVILLPKGVSYSFTCLEPGECLMIEFEAGFPLPVCPVQQFEVSNMAEMIHIFDRLERFRTFKKPSHTIRCMAGLYDILTRLDVARSGSAYPLSSKYDLIRPAVRYLEEHYNDPSLDLAKLSGIAGISSVYFRKIFTEIYRIPPMKYIGLIRIQKAKEMLLGDYSSITSIAEAVGINGIYQFSKMFKSATGYTPSEYSRSRSHEDP